MVALSRKLLRVFPRGPLDLLWQVVLILVAYYAYRLSRGYIDNPQGAAVAFENARTLIDIERSTHLFFEEPLQAFFTDITIFRDAANLLYMNAQTIIAGGALLWIYFRHNDRFYFVRNMFVVSWVIALVGYIVFPTAPPRFFPEWGFTDTVSQFAGVDHTSSVNALFNPYAAVPSMHCAFAIMLGVTLARVSKHRITRWIWGIYPVVMVWCVIVTGNHWVLDAVAGAATAALAAYAAAQLARVRPHAWAWEPQTAPVTARALA